MILTGVRLINVSNLRWEYVDLDNPEIIYPEGVTGMRGTMKTQKEFILPITREMQKIMEEQREWNASVPNCNHMFVFLQPRDPNLPFAKRSLDKLVKMNSPADTAKGITHEGYSEGQSWCI
ncbi:hypothetical protein ARAF_0850 [Arsenophonus endosymbiont of Aleurodicus floccissimus]|nr:hypothetical protein ARAF_0850 [Arsenophonus endosymbiont of Aleurodicus floccissimus]